MSLRVLRGLGGLFAPEGLLVVAAIGAVWWAASDPALARLADLYPYGVFVAGAVLAWRFRRSRLFFALVVLTLADRALVLWPAGAVATAVALLVPVDLLGLALIGERGTLTPAGLARLAVLVVEIVVIAGLAQPAQAAQAAALAHPFVSAGLSAWTPIPQTALVAFAIAFVILGIRAFLKPNATGRGFLWSLVAAFLGLHVSAVPPATHIYFGTSGLILVTSVIEASYFMAYRDELTGLPGRRALTEALERLSGTYTIAMVDVDHFKAFNDTHGHDVGDQVLKMVARHLGEVGGGGKAYRYGGEEFTIVFPNRGLDEAVPHLDAVRATIERATFTLRGPDRPRKKPDEPRRKRTKRRDVSVTVSIGAADTSSRGMMPDAVLQSADRQLYKAKSAGRNRVTA